MPVPFYMDVHVPQAITDQLRRRGVDVMTATEDGWGEREDSEILEHVRQLGRVIFTQDIRFKALAEEWHDNRGISPDSCLVTNSAVRLGNSSKTWNLSPRRLSLPSG